jgi:histidine ammonia-lyase
MKAMALCSVLVFGALTSAALAETVKLSRPFELSDAQMDKIKSGAAPVKDISAPLQAINGVNTVSSSPANLLVSAFPSNSRADFLSNVKSGNIGETLAKVRNPHFCC